MRKYVVRMPAGGVLARAEKYPLRAMCVVPGVFAVA